MSLKNLDRIKNKILYDTQSESMPAKNNKKLTTGIAVSFHYNIFHLADISTSITSKDG